VVVVTEVDSAIHNDGVDDGEEEEDRWWGGDLHPNVKFALW
jgi:hypothetical protein